MSKTVKLIFTSIVFTLLILFVNFWKTNEITSLAGESAIQRQKSMSKAPPAEADRPGTPAALNNSQNKPLLHSEEKIHRDPKERVAEYRAILLNEHVKNSSLTSALMALAIFRDPEARDRALKLLNSKDQQLSSVAFRALGYFDEPAVNAKLGDLLQSNNPETKRASLNALTWSPKQGSHREELLKDYYLAERARQGQDFESYLPSLQILSTLSQMATNKNDKTYYLNQIIDRSRSSKDEQMRKAAEQMLQHLSPSKAHAQR